jgi:hypothetical protein
VYLPDVSVSLPISNGGFDNDLSGWQTGASGGFSLPTATTNGFGDNTGALLGNPSYGNPAPNTCSGGVPVGEVWIAQQVKVPAGSPKLVFDYQLSTQDNANGTYSSFDVYVNGVDDAPHRLFRNPTLDQGLGCSTPAVNFGWQPASASLSAYAGQTITVYFAVFHNTQYNNTYVYLDSVAINP